jgi:uncharacterized caspase-like protein
MGEAPGDSPLLAFHSDLNLWMYGMCNWIVGLPVRRAGLLVLLTCALVASAQARRLALVIGNDNYEHVQTLKNARSDAAAIAAELKAIGFEVTLKQDLTQKMMESALRTFKSQVQGGDDVVFYYSGHGVQFRGTNYLVPVDMTAESESQVTDDAIALQRVLDDLSEQKARFSLAIIDACRTNPFKDSGRAINGRGLATVTPATGQMIMYSAGANQSALDNLGARDTNPHGVFTRVLIDEMRKPGVPAGAMLKNVQSSVVDLAHTVGAEQVPALYDQSLGQFFFRPGLPGTNAAPAAASSTAIHVPSAAELDESYWQGIKSSTDAADFKSYTKSFPTGMHVAEAQMMERKLTRASAKAMPVAAPATGSAASSTPAPASAPAKRTLTALVAGGPYPGWGTSSLYPGSVGTGTITVNADGTVDTMVPNGDSGHTIFDLSDPNDVHGISTTHLGKSGFIQRRYPDGTISTRVTLSGKYANGVISGTYYDKFQTGTFSWTVEAGH